MLASQISQFTDFASKMTLPF